MPVVGVYDDGIVGLVRHAVCLIQTVLITIVLVLDDLLPVLATVAAWPDLDPTPTDGLGFLVMLFDTLVCVSHCTLRYINSCL